MKHRTSEKHNRRQAGLTLVEILVALAVSSILLAGMVQIFASSKTTYNMQDGLSRMQENGRFALQFLTEDLRMGGYFGCLANVDTVINNQINTGSGGIQDVNAFKPGEGIVGWDYTGTSSGNTYTLTADAAPVATTSGWTSSSTTAQGTGTTAVPGSDMVRLWRGGNEPIEILEISGSGGSAQTVLRSSPTNEFGDDDFLLVTDCARAELIDACNVNVKTNETQVTLSAGCTPGNIASAGFTTKVPPGEVVKLVSRLYYIGKDSNSATAPPALFMRELDGTTGTLGNPQELVRGIENMQLMYGEDTNNDGSADRYVDATAITDWHDVVSVRVAVLATSVEDSLPLNETDSNTYNLNGVTINPPDDRQLRQVFTTTITLRNRALTGP